MVARGCPLMLVAARRNGATPPPHPPGARMACPSAFQSNCVVIAMIGLLWSMYFRCKHMALQFYVKPSFIISIVVNCPMGRGAEGQALQAEPEGPSPLGRPKGPGPKGPQKYHWAQPKGGDPFTQKARALWARPKGPGPKGADPRGQTVHLSIVHYRYVCPLF